MASEERTPILPTLVYPVHMLYCPPRLLFANLAVSAFIAMVTGFQPLVMLVTIPLIHGCCVIAYLREPYVVGLAVGRWRARPWWRPGARTRNRVPVAGNKFVV